MESRDIERVLREMKGTFEEKNALYGNSFEESLREWGALVGVSRIGDKMRRLKSLWMSSGCDSGVFVSSGGCGESAVREREARETSGFWHARRQDSRAPAHRP